MRHKFNFANFIKSKDSYGASFALTF